ncbi:MAG: RNA 2',3'-cyclic phosphodiesterase [Candidatus Colwellbacteria bacterium]|nr:RNA 2',3'-cyclic phosphodiesterase [Candidatus Colwellbacteria bacterium]
MKKLFIAIDIGDNVASYLGSYVEGLPNLGGARIVPEENYHITVHFIGYVNEESLKEIQDRIKQAASRSRPFALRLKGVVLAPPGRISTMLWAVFEDVEAFVKLSDDLQQALSKFGGDTQEKVPHVTLVRSRKSLGGVRRCPDVKKIDQLHVNQITLMESTEAQGGVYYKPLAHFLLEQ